jgi:hypothetical protein
VAHRVLDFADHMEAEIFRSADDGITFTKVATDQPVLSQMFMSRANPATLFRYNINLDPASRGGVYRSDDAGLTWRSVGSDLSLLTYLVDAPPGGFLGVTSTGLVRIR